MKTIIQFSLTLALLLIAMPGLIAEDETQEPPVRYNLDVDGKLYSIAESIPFKITGSLINPTIKIIAEPTKEFMYGGITFVYPRNFTFEADIKDPNDKNWTLSGTYFSISYSLLSEKITAEQFADSLVEAFGNTQFKSRSSINIEFLGEKYNGTRLNLILSEQKMTQDIIVIPSKEGTKLFIFQDILIETGTTSKEAIETLALLKKKLPIKESKEVKPKTNK